MKKELHACSLVNKLLYHYLYKGTIYVGNYRILVYIIYFKFFVDQLEAE